MRVSSYLWVGMDKVRTQDVTVGQISNIGCGNGQRPIVANNRHKLEEKYQYNYKKHKKHSKGGKTCNLMWYTGLESILSSPWDFSYYVQQVGGL